MSQHGTPRSRRVGAAAGFTLIELMVVLVVITVILVIAIPNFLGARLTTNETAAIANLRSVWNAEVQFQQSAATDVDGDGSGEFGFLREITGLTGVRTAPDGTTTGRSMNPTVLSAGFRTIDSQGAASRSGYRFVVRLPDDAGLGVHEVPAGAFTSSVNSDLAETTFCLYAWPNTHSSTGSRTFFVNQQGDMTATDDAAYSGANFHVTAADGMAFSGSGPADSITGRAATGTIGRDSNRWRQVN